MMARRGVVENPPRCGWNFDDATALAAARSDPAGFLTGLGGRGLTCQDYRMIIG
jgi:hypothetical protein